MYLFSSTLVPQIFKVKGGGGGASKPDGPKQTLPSYMKTAQTTTTSTFTTILQHPPERKRCGSFHALAKLLTIRRGTNGGFLRVDGPMFRTPCMTELPVVVRLTHTRNNKRRAEIDREALNRYVDRTTSESSISRDLNPVRTSAQTCEKMDL